MSFLYYVAQTERTYCYRIKSIVELDDTAMRIIERVLSRYEPQDISTVSRTIYQAAPIDFPEVRGGEVYILDIKLGLPASPAILRDELHLALNCADFLIRVFGENDPMELQQDTAEVIADMDADAADKGMVPASLLSMENYEETQQADAADHYGNDYNSRFLAYLKTVADDRLAKMKVDAPHPITTWAAQPKDETGEDFNADIEGVKPATKGGPDIKSDDKLKVVRVYTDGKKIDRVERTITDRSKK